MDFTQKIIVIYFYILLHTRYIHPKCETTQFHSQKHGRRQHWTQKKPWSPPFIFEKKRGEREEEEKEISPPFNQFWIRHWSEEHEYNKSAKKK